MKHFLIKISDLPPDTGRTAVAAGKRILILNRGGVISAFINFCPHMGGALRFGGGTLQCLWHGAKFDPETGSALSSPATKGSKLTAIAVIVDGDTIYYDDATADKPASPWTNDF